MGSDNIIHAIDALLAATEPISERQALRLVLASFRDFIQRDESDHQKIVAMYPVFRGLVWFSVAFGASLIGLLFMLATGQAHIVITP